MKVSASPILVEHPGDRAHHLADDGTPGAVLLLVIRRQRNIDEYSEPHLSLWTIAVRTGDYARGEDYLKKAISFGPLNPTAYANLGTLYAMRQNCEEAVRQFKSALAIRPQMVDVQLNLAQCYLDLGHPQEAEGIVAQVLKSHPNLGRAKSLDVRPQQLKKVGVPRP